MLVLRSFVSYYYDICMHFVLLLSVSLGGFLPMPGTQPRLWPMAPHNAYSWLNELIHMLLVAPI